MQIVLAKNIIVEAIKWA